ncbi:MAG TPA: hypothetical protein VFE24_02230 [Pirellulales bacterium]|jgi:hypothetical protein|nr:hypothetical protein [Pirellulales bacterium]
MKLNNSTPNLVLAATLGIAGLAGIVLTWFGVIFATVGAGARFAIFLAGGAISGAGAGLPFKRPLLGAFMGAVFWLLLAEVYNFVVKR